MRRMFGILLIVGMASGVSSADVESGLKAGEKVEKLTAFGVVGRVEGKEADFADLRKDESTVYLFVSAEHFSRPTARFIKLLDGKVVELDAGVEAVAVWLGNDADKSKEYMPRLQMSLKLEQTSLAVIGDPSGPNGWGINPDAHLTVIIVNKGKVVRSFAYTSVNETDVRSVLAELKKAAGK